MPGSLTVRVLGPLEVRRNGDLVTIGGTKPRALLTLLALHAGHVVSSDTLVEVLWGDDPPRTASKALQTHVSVLRRVLGEGAILTRGSGWLLEAADIDAEHFEAAAAAAREAGRAQDSAASVAAFTAALEVWRGAPDLPDTPRARSEGVRWMERRASVTEDRTDALLAQGDAALLVGDLEAQVAATPLRERRWAQLMLALYRTGRQADALAAYLRARAILAEQLGVEPGPELRELEAAILRQDPALEPPRQAKLSQPKQPAHAYGAGALPVQRTTFVGRRDELRRVNELLGAHQLVTITGPGGVGKTRLAIAAAQATTWSVGAVIFVDLVPVSPAFLLHAVAAALGVAERPQQPLADAIRAHLAEGLWLLVMDNCEHVVEAVSELIDQLTTQCPGVVVLATSRERLGAGGEWVITLPGLELDSGGVGAVESSDAVTLFLDRARAIDPDFDADPALTGHVCARLDGLPLAIELAAARCASLGIDGVLTSLDNRMRLLTGARGGPPRHRSMRAVLDWSHDQLGEPERAIFRQVSVFAGGFDLDAAVAVAGDSADGAAVADVVGHLADKSLLTHLRGPYGSRWRFLETIRVYARDRLARSAEEPAVRARHLRWAAATAEELERQLISGDDWRDDFDVLADDLRIALVEAEPSSVFDQREPVHRLALALGHLAYARSYLAEARQHFQSAVEYAAGPDAGRALRKAASVAFAQMRSDLAFDLLLEAADRSAGADDPAGEAISLASAVVLGARCPGSFPETPSAEKLAALLARARTAADDSPLVNQHRSEVDQHRSEVDAHLSAAVAWTAEPVRARCDGPLGEIALAAARRADDPVLISAALDGMTTAALGEGRFREAASIAGRRLELLDQFTLHDPRVGGEISDILHMATETAIAAGDLPGALAAAHRAGSDLGLGLGVPMLPPSRLTLSHALSGAFADALTDATEMVSGWERADRPPAGWMAPALYAAALASGLTGDEAGRAQWSARAWEMTVNPTVQGFAPFVDCRIALYEGRLADAVAIADGLPPGYLGKFDAYARAIGAESAVAAGLPDAADRLDSAAASAEENDWAAACLARARARITRDRDEFTRAVAGWERIGARFERACTLLLMPDRTDEGRAELADLGCRHPAAVRP